jgi:hypothetical protein
MVMDDHRAPQNSAAVMLRRASKRWKILSGDGCASFSLPSGPLRIVIYSFL